MLSDAYMRQWTKQSFVQLVACRLFCAKLFSEPVLAYRWSGHYEQTLKKMFKIQQYIYKEHLNVSSAILSPFPLLTIAVWLCLLLLAYVIRHY